MPDNSFELEPWALSAPTTVSGRLLGNGRRQYQETSLHPRSCSRHAAWIERIRIQGCERARGRERAIFLDRGDEEENVEIWPSGVKAVP